MIFNCGKELRSGRVIFLGVDLVHDSNIQIIIIAREHSATYILTRLNIYDSRNYTQIPSIC